MLWIEIVYYETLLICFSTDVNFIASQALARTQQQLDIPENGTKDTTENNQVDAMAALERQARAPLGFVPASSGPEGGNIKSTQPKIQEVANPDALDLSE